LVLVIGYFQTKFKPMPRIGIGSAFSLSFWFILGFDQKPRTNNVKNQEPRIKESL